MRVFFSHSSRDHALMRELRGYLPRWISAWIDEEQLLFGEDLELSLKAAIDEEVDYVVLFLGHESLESTWVRREVEWALQREDTIGRVFLLPVLLADVRHRMDELGLAGRVTIELAQPNLDGTTMLANRLVNHLGGWMSERLKAVGPPVARRADQPHTRSKVDTNIVAALEAVPSAWRQEVESTLSQPFLAGLMSSQIGQIPLTPSQYYHRILAEMGRASSGWKVLAVSTLTSGLWQADADQTKYAERNLAAVDRGAAVYRLFLVPEGAGAEYDPIIQRQLECRINVRVGTNRLLAEVSDLEDFVLFIAPDGARAFVAHPSIDGSRRIRSGITHLAENSTTRLRETFWNVWELASAPAERACVAPDTARTRSHVRRPAPGLRMEARRLVAPVVTCEEAARARGVPLANELKTLILRTSDGFVAAHLPGDGVLYLRLVKDRLETPEAYLADPEDLADLKLSAGTVSAVLDPVWSMPHLVSRRVLDLKTVTTNNGTRNGYFTFDPVVLVEAADVIVGDFER